MIFSAIDWDGYFGSGVLGCHHVGVARVDCRLSQRGSRCDGVVAVWPGGGARLSWGASLPDPSAAALDAPTPAAGAPGLRLLGRGHQLPTSPVFGGLGRALLGPPD